jgi:pSer/pThr/pTyr-binding forkhead associated (FHA) protein
VSEQLLTILKFCLLALVYLFFFRVLRAVWAELRPQPKPQPVAVAAAGAAPAGSRKERKRTGRQLDLVVVEPVAQRGRRYPLGDELTVGRAAGCGITVDDTFVSQIHARVFRRDGNLYVEDLGSTNGTWLNRNKVAGPILMRKGDRLQVGSTVLVAE